MTLKGNLEVLNLSDIFQSLTQNQHTGTLVVNDGKREKLIYFSEGEISLFTSDRRLRIGELLVSAGKLDPDDLNFALEQQDNLRAGADTQAIKIGEILVDEGFVCQIDVDDVVRAQIEEEIYDLFLWKSAEFEFLIDYCPDRLRSPSCNITKLRFNTNTLIMEAARRLDEWDLISREIHSMKEVYELTDRSPEAIKRVDLPQYIRNDVRLIDGLRNVDQIADEASVTRFELCQLLYELKSLGLLRPLEPEELVERADELFRQGRFRQAAGMYERLAEISPRDLDVQRAYGEALRSYGDDRGAFDQYERIAAQLTGKRHKKELARTYRAMLDIDPSRRDVLEALRQLDKVSVGRSVLQVALASLVLAPLTVLALVYGIRGWNPKDVLATASQIFERSTRENPEVNAEEQDAQQLVDAARTLLGERQYPEAWHQLRSVIERYPNTAVAKQISLPLRVETDPPGKLVYLNGIYRDRTPCVVQYLPDAPSLDLEIREGDRVLYAESLEPRQYNSVRHDLTRKPTWTFVAGGPIRTKPVLFSGGLYFTSLDGKLYGVRASDKTPLYQSSLRSGGLDPLGEATSSPIMVGSQLVVGTVDGSALVTDLSTRNSRPAVRVSDAPLLAQPVYSRDAQAVVFGGHKGDLAFFSLTGAKVEASVPLCVNRITAALATSDKRVYVGSHDNRLIAVDVTSRKPVWQYTAEDDVLAAPEIYTNRVLVGDAAGHLACLRQSDGTVLWKVPFQAEITGLAASKGVVIATTGNGFCHGVDIETGKVDWSVQLQDIALPPIVEGRTAYLVTRGGAVHAIDILQDGASVWLARLNTKTLGPPAVLADRLVFGTEDGRLICFDLETP
ncbi:MAG: outer membrane protein assembly factor BamB family protein [Planctomycetota bacterium]